MSVHQMMTHYVAIEMGTAARALMVWQEAEEELITLICVQQVFLADVQCGAIVDGILN